MLSARLGDVLAELYLLSAVLKRWQHEGRHDADLPLVQCCLEQGFVTIERRLDEVLLNFPSRALSFFLRALVLPFFWRAKPPSDKGSEVHTSELQSLMRTSYAVLRLKKKKYISPIN